MPQACRLSAQVAIFLQLAGQIRALGKNEGIIVDQELPGAWIFPALSRAGHTTTRTSTTGRTSSTRYAEVFETGRTLARRIIVTKEALVRVTTLSQPWNLIPRASRRYAAFGGIARSWTGFRRNCWP